MCKGNEISLERPAETPNTPLPPQKIAEAMHQKRPEREGEKLVSILTRQNIHLPYKNLVVLSPREVKWLRMKMLSQI